jgi:hypothetical protein
LLLKIVKVLCGVHILIILNIDIMFKIKEKRKKFKILSYKNLLNLLLVHFLKNHYLKLRINIFKIMRNAIINSTFLCTSHKYF